jgi:serine/threonine-protein kinase
VCEVTDFGVDENGQAFLVMPLLDGASFGALMRGPGALSASRIVDIACQTLSALEAAHRNDIVHRDLKPDNIFVTAVGDRKDFVKLLDFGISKYLGPDAVTRLTRTGLVPGTPLYMAPEQASGEKHLDHRADLYAVGVILYEAFTGELPFDGDSYNEILFKIAAKPFKNPRMINPDIPVAVEAVITKAMARNPKLRFADAAEMREALEQIDQAELASDLGRAARAGQPPSGMATENAPSATEPFSGSRRQTGAALRSKRPLWKMILISLIVVFALAELVVTLFGLTGYFFL